MIVAAEITHAHEPGDDTVEVLRDVVAILLDEEPHERHEGEAA